MKSTIFSLYSRGLWIVLLLAVISGSSVSAGLLSKMDYMLHSWPKKHRIQTLLVTGNYVKSRLLAELVQHHTEHPLLLVNPANGTTELYFMPYADEAMQLDEAECIEFVELVNPKRVLFVGGPRYIPDSVAEKIESRVSSVRVSSPNWAKNAKALADMFMYRKLPERFARYYGQLEKSSRSQQAPPPSFGR